MVATGLILFLIGTFIINAYGAESKTSYNAANYIGVFAILSGIALVGIGLIVFLWRYLP